MEASLGFLSAGCNRVANTAAWCHSSGVVAFGCGPLVALCDPLLGCCFATLKGHAGRVNSLSWVDSQTLLSGDSLGVLCVWRALDGKWVRSEALQEHEGKAVTFVTCRTSLDGKTVLAVSAGVDCSVVVHRRLDGEGSFRAVQRLRFPNRMIECMDLALLEGGGLLLACGGVDCCIHLYQCDRPAQEGEGEPLFAPIGELQGHDDWIRCLRFAEPDEEHLLLASASQDFRIRLWRFSKVGDPAVEQAEVQAESGYNTDVVLSSGWRVTLDSVLPGHEEWVYSLDWHPSLRKPRSPEVASSFVLVDPSQVVPVPCTAGQPVHHLLLSASMDRSMILWAPDKSSGLWLATAQVGEFGGIAGLFGQLGYYGACFSPRGDHILAHAYNGSFHLWGFQEEDASWQPRPTCSGHQGPVTDIMWDTRHDYLISTSLDQTSRLYAPWIRDEMPREPLVDEAMASRWGVDGRCFDASRAALFHELARPQIHGYDIRSLTPISRHSFASGADEKLVRVFRAPKLVVDSLCQLSDCAGSRWGVEDDCGPGAEEDGDDTAVGASVAALGLSNKAVLSRDLDEHGVMGPVVHEGEEGQGGDWGEEVRFRALALDQPPFEEHLLQSTLWPETQKLYGHPDDIVCVTASHCGRFLAAACKAKTEKGAFVRVWDRLRRWTQVCALPGHKLTVTQLAFSHDDRLLVSVSKDRRIALFQRNSEEAVDTAFSVATVVDSKHTRIIWSCSWSHDDQFLVTGSRDKKVRVWRVLRSPEVSLELVWASRQLPLGPVTAVACCPVATIPGFSNLFAVGFECGEVILMGMNEHTEQYETLLQLDPFITHSAQVRRLTWRDPERTARAQALWRDRPLDGRALELASCAEDHTARLFRLQFPEC